jgi:hypothetical protein
VPTYKIDGRDMSNPPHEELGVHRNFRPSVDDCYDGAPIFSRSFSDELISIVFSLTYGGSMYVSRFLYGSLRRFLGQFLVKMNTSQLQDAV